MIGRFLMGLGLGALVGAGGLVMAALVAPRPAPVAKAPAISVPEAKPAPAPAAAPAAEAPAAPKPEADPAPEPAPELAPKAPPADPVSQPAAAPAAVTEAPAPPAPVTGSDAALPEPAAAAPAAPAAVPPAALAVPGAELAPAAPPVPAAAPDLAAAAPPAAPAAPAAPAEATAPGTEGAGVAAAPPPAAPAPPPAEAAPAAGDPPGLPPLTDEEKDLLAKIAADGPGAVPPELRPAEPAEPAAPPEGPAVLPPPGGGTLQDDPARRLAVGEGSTLPPAPALAGEGVVGNAQEPGDLPAIGAEPAPEPAPEPASQKPVDLYARPFDNPAAKPAFAVILLDGGEATLDRAALAALPFPVTFALDPLAPGAAAQAAVYRAAGQEVVMLASGVPRRAAASDIEVAFQTMAAAMPESVAVMDLPERRFQADRPLATLVVPVIGAQGRGLVSWDEGLNAADQVARREDVPAAVIFRALDAEDESAPVIRRYLDRAAFKAVQDGQVVVVGHARPETVAALMEWAVEGRAATVALAPLTAVLSVD